MENSMYHWDQKVKNVRQLSHKKPDIETLYKAKEDIKFGVWERYLLGQRDKQKQLRKNMLEK